MALLVHSKQLVQALPLTSMAWTGLLQKVVYVLQLLVLLAEGVLVLVLAPRAATELAAPALAGPPRRQKPAPLLPTAQAVLAQVSLVQALPAWTEPAGMALAALVPSAPVPLARMLLAKARPPWHPLMLSWELSVWPLVAVTPRLAPLQVQPGRARNTRKL